jgi:DNA-binding IclR family transcriptional regulator
LSEITRLLKKPTVHRLATDLVAKRIRERGIYDYRLGLHLFELGQRARVAGQPVPTAGASPPKLSPTPSSSCT